MPITVFIADDHAMVRDGLRMILEAQGDIKVIGEAADGRAAVKLVRELNPDVTIMDISMPALNGIDATKQILKNNPSAKVIILTMYSTTEHVYQAFRAKAVGYLLKESAGLEVVKAVRSVHTGERYLCQQIADHVIDDYVHKREVAPESPLQRLSDREREILQMVVEGKTSAEIAKILDLSPKTVETYRSRLMEKLEVHDLPSLVKFAIRHGLTGAE
ncbi:MAG: response regulator transcription factor [Nitrospirota bacterium]